MSAQNSIIIGLCLSFGLIGAILLIHSAWDINHFDSEVEIVNLVSSNKLPILGEYQLSKHNIELEKLTNGRALLIFNGININTDELSILRYKIANFPTNLQINFFWRSQQNPELLNNIPLYFPNNSMQSINLSTHEDWQGMINEAGFAIQSAYGESNDLTLTKKILFLELVLDSSSILNNLSVIFSDWLAFMGWSGTSVNTVFSPTDIKGAIQPWQVVLIAIILLFIISLITKLWFKLNLFYVLLGGLVMGWLVLDILWQKNLVYQVKETISNYSNVDMQDRRLIEADVDLFTFAENIKKQLPEKINRIVIFSTNRKTSKDFFSQKLRYFLLPNQVGVIFRPRMLEMPNLGNNFDYALIVNNHEGLSFDSEKESLKFTGREVTIPASKIWEGKLGNLYKINTEERDD